jgi:hypothetical protein
LIWTKPRIGVFRIDPAAANDVAFGGKADIELSERDVCKQKGRLGGLSF